jgi:hypothetical protein
MKMLHCNRKWNQIVLLSLFVLLPATSVVGAPRFVSLEGRFSISLPDRSSLKNATIPTPFGDRSGDLYEWKTKEGTFSVGYVDSSQPINDPEALKQFFDEATERFRRLTVANGGDIAEVKKITLDKHPGIEQRVDLSRGTIIRRMYIVTRRTYELYVVVKDSQREAESTAVGVLNSFKLLTDSEITEEALKAGPRPLPQTPEAPRAGSDAADEGLRGPVKSVHTEIQYLSETPLTHGGTRSSLTTYNKNGNKLRTESYDFKNNLDLIEVYGYLDGSRVSAYKIIQREYSLPVGTMRLPSNKKKDPRYEHRFEFKYDEKKRLTEETRFFSDGEILERSVYKYEGNQKEKLVYSENGSLVRRNLYILDDKGNVIEDTGFTRDGSVYAKRSYTYEFDSNGNWIKRTSSGNVVSKRPGLEPPSVHLRTITYY